MVNPSNAEHDNQNKQHKQSTNHVPKNPQQSKSKPETKTTHSDTETYLPFDCPVRVRKINGKTHFLVKWKDGSPYTWEPEENISDTVLREYYSTHTKSGKRRKKKQMQFFQRSQDRQLWLALCNVYLNVRCLLWKSGFTTFFGIFFLLKTLANFW